MAEQLSHVDEEGRAKMVDVSAKKLVHRVAKAAGRIVLRAATVELIKENRIKKGDVLTVAQIAGIQAAKRTSELVPLCHPLPIDKIDVKATANSDGVLVESEVACVGRTGVEMEALTAVSVALLTVYDMCKAVDKSMKIGEIVLVSKTKKDVEPSQ